MSKRSLSTRIISVFLGLTFIAGQIYAAPLDLSSNKLSPSTALDSDINPVRSTRVQGEIAGELHPGAIGKGAPLVRLLKGELPPRISVQEVGEKRMDKIRQAIYIAISLVSDNRVRNSVADGMGLGYIDILNRTASRLISLGDRINNDAYLHNMVVDGAEDYLGGFNTKDNIGLSVELIDRLSPRLLAQYIFHECIPEGLMSRDIEKGHKIAYSKFQPLVFSSTMTVVDPVTKESKKVSEIDALKIELRNLINELSLPEEILSQVRQLKKQTLQGEVNEEHTTQLKERIRELYNNSRLYDLPLQARERFCLEVFDSRLFPRVNEAIRSIFDTVVLARPRDSLDPDSAFNLMQPSMYHTLAGALSIIEGTHTIAENDNIRFAVDLILFDFLRPHEKRVIELLWLTGEIEKELEKPGSGKLPAIVAMQDLHGGARRALALIGFVLGLPSDCYTRLYTLSDLQNAITEAGIDVSGQDLRIIGLNDKYDRGEDPEGIFALVKWLRDIGKAKPFVGNHDLWRTMSVLGVHFIPGVSMEKTHGVGFWSKDAMAHAGWGTIELDQINERRFNAEITRVNAELAQHGLTLLSSIDLREFRNSINSEMKRLKKLNAAIRTENENRSKVEPGYERKDEHKLPDIFTKSLGYLRDQVRDRNTAIPAMNTEHGLSIPKISFQEVNLDNYMDDPDVVARALWELQNFRLFYIDVLGNIHMHSLIPLDFENKKIMVSYKGTQGISALERMQEDIRRFFEGMATIPNDHNFRMKMWESLGEAFTEINRWYSDLDAHAKAASVKRFVDNGGPAGFNNEFIGSAVTQFADRFATFLMVIGHNERKKFDGGETPLPWIIPSPETGSGLANIDYEMSEGYSDRGAVVTIFRRDKEGRVTGIRQWGYPAADKALQQKQADVVDIVDITMTDTEGLSAGEEKMLEDLSDGEKFMRWYRLKALKEAADLMAGLIENAGSAGRLEKKKEYERLQADVTGKIRELEKDSAEAKAEAVSASKVVPKEPSQVSGAEDAEQLEVITQINNNIDINAMRFITQLNTMEDRLREDPNQEVFIGIESDLGGSQQRAIIQNIKKAIGELKKKEDASGRKLFPKIIVERDTAENLTMKVNRRKEAGTLDLDNVFIGAKARSVEDQSVNPYGGIKGSAWIAAIDETEPESYLPVFEAITLNMMARLGADLSALEDFYNKISKSNRPETVQNMRDNKVFYIVPKATKVDPNERKKLHDRMVESIDSAA